MTRVLIVDDSREFTGTLSRQLQHRGYTVQTASSGEAGLKLALEWCPGLVLLDLRLADMSGLDVLQRLRLSLPDVPVVIATAFPEVTSAVAAIRGKVFDYLCKPFPVEELLAVLERIAHAGTAPVPSPRDAQAVSREALAAAMVGASPATQALRDLIRQLAGSGVRAALITGESGTGKDLAARLFHDSSARRAGPFVAVNCSAVSEGLFESEFFGHERGAFTGAVGTHRGFVELAHGGTLFLDEVGEIPLPCQPKLLRFLDDQSFVRVGGSRKVTVDVQIIAATNRDLRDMVAQWTFRQDLYFRLNVVPIEIRPLRERAEDILPLATHWLGEANTRYGKSVRGFTPGVEAALRASAWPGNVREMRNVIERLVILNRGDLITEAELPAEIARAVPAAPVATAEAAEPFTESLEDAERRHIRHVLARMSGNKTRAAEVLGISRQTLRAKLEGA